MTLNGSGFFSKSQKNTEVPKLHDSIYFFPNTHFFCLKKKGKQIS